MNIELDGDKCSRKQRIVLRKQDRTSVSCWLCSVKGRLRWLHATGCLSLSIVEVWAGELEWLLCWSMKSEDSTYAFISTSTTASALYNWQSLPTASLPAIRVLTFASLYNKTAEQFYLITLCPRSLKGIHARTVLLPYVVCLKRYWPFLLAKSSARHHWNNWKCGRFIAHMLSTVSFLAPVYERLLDYPAFPRAITSSLSFIIST